MLVGIADTFVVSYCKEAAVSGVSLVNSFNTIFLFLFTALSSGGAVIVSQYLGRKENATASQAASQLFSLSLLFSLAVAVVTVVGNEEILGFLFGRVEPEVMEAGITYLRISAYSYPLLAVYNAGAALYRSIGKTSTTMYISVLANFINVAGNCIGVFLLHAGVAGMAWPSFLSRGFSALLITGLCFRKSLPIRYRWQWIFTWNSKLQNYHCGNPPGIFLAFCSGPSERCHWNCLGHVSGLDYPGHYPVIPPQTGEVEKLSNYMMFWRKALY